MRKLNILLNLTRPACFNPLDRGNLYRIIMTTVTVVRNGKEFQSPRSGKFVSDFFQRSQSESLSKNSCFNPLDRGNLYQIYEIFGSFSSLEKVFQSPRSGKFVSDPATSNCATHQTVMFQSPRSGKFVSDTTMVLKLKK